MFESGAPLNRLMKFLRIRKEIASVEKSSERRDELKAEADAMRELIKTDVQRKKDQLDRIDLLRKEGLITVMTAKLATEELEKQGQVVSSIMGRTEGLQALHDRISSSAAGMRSDTTAARATAKATMKVATSTNKTAKASIETEKNTKKTSEFMQSIILTIEGLKDAIPLVGAFG